MAKGFKDTEGQAKKGGEYYKWVDGDQSIRLVGDIVPRYVYWKSNGTRQVAIECLSFDRDQEKFTNIEKDWFQEFFPEQKCSWAYVGRAINPADKTKTILIPLKKKMYQQIQDVAEDLGDPTDPVSGWDCAITRTKTGSAAFNVEYTLKALKCRTRPLDDEEIQAVKDMPPIDDLVPRQTSADQKVFIQQQFFNTEATETDTSAAEAAADDGADLPH